MLTRTEPDRETLRLLAIQVAAARQAIARAANSYLPAWEDLTDQERATAATEAGWWLEAVRRAGLTARTVPARWPTPTAPATKPKARPCGHCGKPVINVPRGGDHQLIPLDADPSDSGTFVILSGFAAVLLPKQAAVARAAGQQLRTHHRWTCPYTHRWANNGQYPHAVTT